VAVVSGVVHTSAGHPVAEARVLFSSGPVPLPDIATLTDQRGAFALTAPAPGTYELTVAANGFTATQQLEISPGQERLDIDITLEIGTPP
jgi:Carboxypeptidase regulatory-like domain